MSKDDATRSFALVQLILPILAGHEREITGAALADLTAIWLAGHFDGRGPAATARLRKTILKLHVQAVQDLIRPNETIILKRQRENETMQ